VRFNRILSILVLAGAPLVACAGAPGKDAESAEQAQNEEKAARLLERARELKNADRYRQLVLRFPDTRAGSDARDELASILIKDAEKALAEEDWPTAEDRAEEARMYAGLDLTRKAQSVQKLIDEKRAEQIAKQAKKQVDEGKCASALKQVAAPVRQKSREHFKLELRRRAQEPLVACVSKQVDEDVKQGNVEAARSFLASPDTTAALSGEGYQLAEQALLKAIVAGSTAELGPLLAAQKWNEAVAKLDELRDAGKLGAAEYPLAFELVQDAIRDHSIGLAKAGVSAAKPSEVARRIDEQIAIAKWKSVPKELQAARDQLAIAVECENQRCKLGKPAPMWAWGKIELAPPANAAGEPTGALAHAQQVWVLGRGGKRALVATEDPGAATGAELVTRAAGWADTTNLRATDTEMWLPPEDQLVGVQVWGPLRPPAKQYLLGIVSKVEGKKATVKRMADSREETVELAELRIGKLNQGLKVMAFCTNQIHPEPAKVDSIVSDAGGSPKVKVICEKGDLQKVELGAALTTKAEWLPPRKP
jgi:hypothetical protein